MIFDNNGRMVALFAYQDSLGSMFVRLIVDHRQSLAGGEGIFGRQGSDVPLTGDRRSTTMNGTYGVDGRRVPTRQTSTSLRDANIMRDAAVSWPTATIAASLRDENQHASISGDSTTVG